LPGRGAVCKFQEGAWGEGKASIRPARRGVLGFIILTGCGDTFSG